MTKQNRTLNKKYNIEKIIGHTKRYRTYNKKSDIE